MNSVTCDNCWTEEFSRVFYIELGQLTEFIFQTGNEYLSALKVHK